MEPLHRQSLDCPYCGETITGEADPATGSHAFIEDCPVCCSPIEYRLETAPDGSWNLSARRDDDV